MSTTSSWVPLLITALASIGGTIAGVIITQRRSDRREAVQWARMREQERERWTREDSLRTFDQRCTSYIDFEEKLRSIALLVEEYQTRLGSLDDDWQLPAYRSLLRLRVFSTTEAAEAANDAYNALLRWGKFGNSYEGDVAAQNAEIAFDEACEKFVVIMRRDLRIDLEPPVGK